MMEYMVYFVSDGVRECIEIVKASSREEAKSHYKRKTNTNNEDIKAIPRIDVLTMHKTLKNSKLYIKNR